MRNFILWLHAVSVITWFGGLFFYLVVAAPAARKASAGGRMVVQHEIDQRFRHVLWGSVEVAVLSGIALLVLTMLEKGTLMKVSGAYTRVLMGKLFLSAVIVGLQIYNQIRINPRKASLAQAPTAGNEAEFADLQTRTLQVYSMELVLAAGLVLLGQHMSSVL